MKKSIMIAALTTASLLAGCASVTEYKAFEGVREGIVEGRGGAKVISDGIEIWDDGEPPRKFKIIGFIDDKYGADWIFTRSHRGDIVKKAREAGGDAVVKVNTQSQLDGFYSAGGASATVYGVYARPSNYGSDQNSISKYAVIKYIKP